MDSLSLAKVYMVGWPSIHRNSGTPGFTKSDLIFKFMAQTTFAPMFVCTVLSLLLNFIRKKKEHNSPLLELSASPPLKVPQHLHILASIYMYPVPHEPKLRNAFSCTAPMKRYRWLQIAPRRTRLGRQAGRQLFPIHADAKPHCFP